MIFLISWEEKDRELYEGLLWIGLENALYQKKKEK